MYPQKLPPSDSLRLPATRPEQTTPYPEQAVQQAKYVKVTATMKSYLEKLNIKVEMEAPLKKMIAPVGPGPEAPEYYVKIKTLARSLGLKKEEVRKAIMANQLEPIIRAQLTLKLAGLSEKDITTANEQIKTAQSNFDSTINLALFTNHIGYSFFANKKVPAEDIRRIYGMALVLEKKWHGLEAELAPQYPVMKSWNPSQIKLGLFVLASSKLCPHLTDEIRKACTGYYMITGPSKGEGFAANIRKVQEALELLLKDKAQASEEEIDRAILEQVIVPDPVFISVSLAFQTLEKNPQLFNTLSIGQFQDLFSYALAASDIPNLNMIIGLLEKFPRSPRPHLNILPLLKNIKSKNVAHDYFRRLDKVAEINKDEILEACAKSKDFHSAALMIALGADPLSAAHVPPFNNPEKLDALHHYAELLANGSPAEQAFRSNVYLKTLGLYAGDSLIRKMLDDSGNKLEGSNPIETGRFVAASLEYYLQQREWKLSSANKLKLDSTIRHMRTVTEAGEKLHSFLSKHATGEAVAYVQDKIDALKSGETTQIPIGWYDAGGTGHAILLEIRKLPDHTFLFSVFNTGDGIQYHEKMAHQKLSTDTFKAYQITADAIKDLNIIGLLLEPMLEGGQIGMDAQARKRYGPEELYSVLKPFELKAEARNEMLNRYSPSYLNDRWMKAQMSGTCAMRSLLAYIRSELGSEIYKDLRSFTKREMAEMIVDQHGSLLEDDFTLTTVLGKLFPSLHRHLIKEGKAAHSDVEITPVSAVKLAQLRRARKLYEIHRGEREISRKPGLQADLGTVPCNTSQQIIHSLQRNAKNTIYAGWAERLLVEKSFIPDKPELENLDATPQTWISFLSQAEQFTSDLNEESADFFVRSLFSNMLHLLHEGKPDAPNAFTKMLSHLNQEQAFQIAVALQRLSERLFIAGGASSDGDPSRKISLYTALMLGWEAIKSAEENDRVAPRLQVSQFPPSYADLEDSTREARILVPGSSADLMKLLERMKSAMPSRDHSRHNIPATSLFCWENYFEGVQHVLHFPYGSAEETIARAILQNLGEPDKKQCVEDMEKALRSTTKNFDKETWQLHWLLVNKKLPSSFYPLFKMAAMARIENHKKIYPSSQFPESFLHGPFFEDDRSDSGKVNIGISIKKEGGQDLISVLRDPIGFESTPRGFPEDRGEFTTRLPLALEILERVVNTPEKKAVTQIYTSPFLWTPDRLLPQNVLLTGTDASLHDLLVTGLARETSPEGFQSTLPITMLIDHFRSHPEDFKAPARRQFFAALFLSDTVRLIHTYKDNPALIGEWREFFHTAENYLEADFTAHPGDKNTAAAYLFILEQKALFLNFLQDNQLPFPDSELFELMGRCNALNDILMARDEPQLLQQGLLVALAVLSGPNFNHPKALNLLLQFSAKYQQLRNLHGLSPYSSPLLENIFKQTLEKKHKLLIEYMDSVNAKPFADILKAYSIAVPENFAPVRQGHCLTGYVGRAKYQFDLLNGTLAINNVVGKSTKPLLQDPLYQEVFGDSPFLANWHYTIVLGEDSLGPFKMTTIKDKVQDVEREFNLEQWGYHNVSCSYFSLSRDAELMKDFADLYPLQAWVAVKESKEKLIVYVDPSSKAVKAVLDSAGNIRFAEDPSKSWEYLRLDQLPEGLALQGFAEKAELFRETGVDNPRMILSIPKMLTPDGQPLKFVRQIDSSSGEYRWALESNPHLRIAKDQHLRFMRGVAGYLILETPSGEKQALWPLRTIGKKVEAHPIPDDLSLPKIEGPYLTKCVMTGLEDGSPVTNNPSLNALLAYHCLAKAAQPEDYSRALEFLKKAYRYESLTDEDYRILGWIINQGEETTDNTVFADSVRLYAAWLVHDNVQRNGMIDLSPADKGQEAQDHPPPNALPAEWKKYWLQDAGMGMPIGRKANMIINSMMKEYISRHQSLPMGLRLENLLAPNELFYWQLLLSATLMPAFKEAKPLKVPEWEDPKNPLDVNIYSLSNIYWTPSLPIEIALKPTASQMESQFKSYYEEIKSGDPKRQDKVRYALSVMRYDSEPNHYVLRLVLQAALNVYSGEKKIPGAEKLIQEFETKYYVDRTISAKEAETEKKDFQTLLQEFRQGLFVPEEFAGLEGPDLIPNPPPDLPQNKPVLSRMEFHPLAIMQREYGALRDIQSLYQQYFTVPPVPEKMEAEAFSISIPDPFIQATVEQLNEDYLIGAAKNRSVPQHMLKEGASVESFRKNAYERIDTLHRASLLQAQGLYYVILWKANGLPPEKAESLLREAELGAGVKQLLTIDDCKALFIQGDREEIRKRTSLKTDKEIDEFYNQIGTYLMVSRKAGHLAGIAGKLEVLPKTASADDQQALLHQIGQLLQQKDEYQPGKDPPAFLVFQENLGLYLRKDQVEGLRKMFPDDGSLPNLLVQRIQGGGKSLIFGHVSALLKADGYHLSLHVAPSPQYPTAIYDMAHLSGRVFGQKESTFVFDDAPWRFTPLYLDILYLRLQQAIINKEYVTVTNETLRAMRSKYLKTHEEIQQLIATDPKSSRIYPLSEANSSLKKILALFKDRGVFTFDEAHLAFNPYEELNMPTGGISHIDTHKIELISDVIQAYARGVAIADIPNALISKWVPHFGIAMPPGANAPLQEEAHRQQVLEYVSGKSERLPEFLRQANEEAKLKGVELSNADYVVLLRQLIAGGWLKERLEKNVDEHYGFPLKDEGPRVSVPFVANMKPAEGAEFSDQVVMLINTFLAYLKNGLNERQASALVQFYREIAMKELMELQRLRPDASLLDTPAYVRFFEATQMDLISFNNQDPKAIKTLQDALLRKTPKSNALMFEYVASAELSQVSCYSKQVSTNGQNTASMGKAALAYTASVENPSMAPAGMSIEHDIGTNGQTIDLLIRKNDDVWISGKEPESLLQDILAKHPHGSDFRGIMDAGCHFRGIPHKNVALMICDYFEKVPDSVVKGVLYFDQSTGKLNFMSKAKPNTTKELSGTRPEIIRQETGFSPEELFTYYDQDHIVGVDLEQFSKGRGIVTIDPKTKLPSLLQAANRFRGLKDMQRLTIAVQQEGLKDIAKVLGKPEILRGAKGEKATHNVLNIRDIIMAAHLNEASRHPDENLIFCMQKIEDLLQTAILDKMYKSSSQINEEAIFRAGRRLFVKSASADLVREYGFLKQDMDTMLYIAYIREAMLKGLDKIFNEAELLQLRNDTNAIMDSFAGRLPVRKKVPVGFRENSATARMESREQTQVRVQQTTVQNLRIAEMRTHVQSQLNQETPALEYDLEDDDFSFFTNWQIFNDNVMRMPRYIALVPVQEVIAHESQDKYPGLFSPSLYVSTQFIRTTVDNPHLLGSTKHSKQLMMVRWHPPEGEPFWTTTLLTVHEAKTLEKMLKTKPNKTDADFILVRPNGKIVASAASQKHGEKDLPGMFGREGEPHTLMMQALFLNGDLKSLDNPLLLQEFEHWLRSHREMARRFFEEEIAHKQPGYETTKAYKALYLI